VKDIIIYYVKDVYKSYPGDEGKSRSFWV